MGQSTGNQVKLIRDHHGNKVQEILVNDKTMHHAIYFTLVTNNEIELLKQEPAANSLTWEAITNLVLGKTKPFLLVESPHLFMSRSLFVEMLKRQYLYPLC